MLLFKKYHVGMLGYFCLSGKVVHMHNMLAFVDFAVVGMLVVVTRCAFHVSTPMSRGSETVQACLLVSMRNIL